MKNFVIIIFFLLNLLNSNAQKLEGIWVSTHRVHFLKTDGVVQKDSSVAVSTVIIDFTGNNEFFLKEFGKEKQLGSIIKKGGTLEFRMEKLVFNGRIENDQLTLELENEKNLDKFIFRRMRSSQLKEEDLFDSASMSNSTWSIQAQKDSKNYCVKFHFLSDTVSSDPSNSPTVEISKTCGEYGYTVRGIYAIDSYKNHLFLGVRNYESADEDVYHLYSRKDALYEGYSYEREWFTDGNPVLNELSLVKNKELESEDRMNLKSALLGEWETVEFHTRFDSLDSDYDQLEDEKLQIILNQNGTFSLTHQGTLVNETMALAQKRIKNGTWSLSKNGTYIKMVYEKNIANEVITISELSGNELTLFYDIQNLNEDLEGRYGMSRMKIRMIRSTAPNNGYD